MISYQSGKKNDKADALTRKPTERLTDDEDEQRKHSVCMLLPLNRINHGAELQPIEEDHVDWTNSDTNSNASNEISPLPE